MKNASIFFVFKLSSAVGVEKNDIFIIRGNKKKKGFF